MKSSNATKNFPVSATSEAMKAKGFTNKLHAG